MDEELQKVVAQAIADGIEDPDALDAIVAAYQQRKAATTSQPEQKLAGVGIKTVSDEDWAKLSPAEKLHGLTQAAGHGIASLLGLNLDGHTGNDAVDNPGATLATAAVPGVIGGAARYGSPIVRAGAMKAADVLEHPAVGGAAGAYHGYQTGGFPGMIIEGAAGMLGGSALAKKLRGLASKPAVPVVEEPLPTQPRSSVDANGSAPSTETSMRSGAPMPSAPVPFVMTKPVESYPAGKRTGTDFKSSAPSAPTAPKGDGFGMNVKADAPKPQAPPRTGTGSSSATPPGPTNPKGNGFRMSADVPPKPKTETPKTEPTKPATPAGPAKEPDPAAAQQTPAGMTNVSRETLDDVYRKLLAGQKGPNSGGTYPAGETGRGMMRDSKYTLDEVYDNAHSGPEVETIMEMIKKLLGGTK